MLFYRNFRYSVFYYPGSKKRCDPPKARAFRGLRSTKNVPLETNPFELNDYRISV